MRTSHPRVVALHFLAALFAISCLFDAHALALAPEAMQSMVIVEGDQGRGSGFVVAMDGKTYVVTNAHVVRGNKNLSLEISATRS